jgi:hypothetical protein
VYPLVVEDVRKVPGFDSISQVIVRLPDAINTTGDFGISLTYFGRKGNRAFIKIQ